MKASRFFVWLLSVSFLFACASVPDKGNEPPVKLFAVEGFVLEASGSELVLSVQIPQFPKTSDAVVADIANQVVRKSYLLEGTRLSIDGQEGTIREVRGNQVKLAFDRPLSYAPGRKVSVQVPKKTIAVVDFEVLGGNRREKGRVVLEGLTSALIDTGQLVVVERAKLQPIMSEIQLSLSGMTQAAAGGGLAGKLLSADLILTGTLTDMQEEWEINLRILNVRTGQAMSAVSMRTKLFKATELRDSGAWGEDFDGPVFDPAWVLVSASRSAKDRRQGRYSVHVDSAQGAEGSQKSLRLDFDFSGPLEREFYALASNRKKRDLSLYQGVEFYARGTESLVGQFYILASQPDDAGRMDQWTGHFPVENTWQKVRVPFRDLIVSAGWVKGGSKRLGATPGDQVMRLNRVEGVQFGIGSAKNGGRAGSLWIDRIRFYND